MRCIEEITLRIALGTGLRRPLRRRFQASKVIKARCRSRLSRDASKSKTMRSRLLTSLGITALRADTRAENGFR